MTRKLTLWITGGAAAASLGMGAAFAHAVPGHAASSSGNTGAPAPASSAAPHKPASGTTPRTSQPQPQHSQLSQPQQQPTHTTAPPVVTSGGS
jgi:hypothetical protein